LSGNATVVGVLVGDGIGEAESIGVGVEDAPSPLEATWSPHAVRSSATAMSARSMLRCCHRVAARTSDLDGRNCYVGRRLTKPLARATADRTLRRERVS
jgi:hypothetical protein